MIYNLDFYIVSHLITGAVAVVLGILVFSKNIRGGINRTFGLLTLSVAIWSFSYSVWLLQKNPESALFWARTLNMGATLIPLFYFHWIIELLKKKDKKRILILYYILTFIFIIYSYSNYYVSGTRKLFLFPYWPQMNWLYLTFLLVGWSNMWLHGLLLLIKELKNSAGLYKVQIKYVIWGSLIGFIGGSTNFLLMMGLELFPPIGSPLVAAYPIFFGYSIVRHRLMDIKLVMRRYSVYLLSLATIITAVIGVKIIINYYQATSVWFDFIILVFALSFFPGLRDYYYRLANKYFFSSLYDSREVISSLSDKLKATLEIERVYRSLSETLTKYFHVKSLGVLTFDENTGEYKVRYNLGFNIGDQKIFKGDRRLHELYIKQGEPIVIEELKNKFYVQFKEILDLFMSLGVEILTPLNIKDKTIGILALGQKESGDMYNEEDLAVLKILSAQTAIAMENALLYEETKSFNIKLKKEIERATTELREANVQLKKLDAAKSDFISIASHQLRTPLTAIKGYISMILEGDFGEVSQVVHDSLHKVFESSERLIHLVEDLLSISRIESGRIQFNFEDIALEKTVASVIEELARNAEKKGIKLEYKKSLQKLELISADEEKIRQVVINLIDNAIKYTPKGKVQVSLQVDKGFLEFCVADTGMGIKTEDQKNLFQKFSRGTGTSLVHTEGTGLGLYVAREMIEAHHGKIWAESAGEGKGSKFCVKLPIVKQESNIKKKAAVAIPIAKKQETKNLK